jgi:UDP-glucose 4-epimerase
MRAVVTGGTGFIGSHIVDLLIKREYEVLVIDNVSSGWLGNLAALSNDKTELCFMDVRDNVTLTHEFSSFSPDLVFISPDRPTFARPPIHSILTP